MKIYTDLYLAIFLVAFIVLAGAWLGFWVVRKIVLAEDGSVDTSTSHFVAWSIRILAAVMILQSSVDLLLAVGLLLFGIVISSILRKIFKLRFFRHLNKSLTKTAKSSRRKSEVRDLYPFEESYDRFPQEIRSPESNFLHHRGNSFGQASTYSPVQGLHRVSHPVQARTILLSTRHQRGENSQKKIGRSSPKTPQRMHWKNLFRLLILANGQLPMQKGSLLLPTKMTLTISVGGGCLGYDWSWWLQGLFYIMKKPGIVHPGKADCYFGILNYDQCKEFVTTFWNYGVANFLPHCAKILYDVQLGYKFGIALADDLLCM